MHSILKTYKSRLLIIFTFIFFLYSGNLYLEKKSLSKKPIGCNDYQSLFKSGDKTIENVEYHILFCKIFSYDRDSTKFRILVFSKNEKEILVKRYFDMHWGASQSVFWEENKLFYYDDYHKEGIINFPPTWWDWFRANYL